MTRSRLFLVAGFVAMFALLVCNQLAVAQARTHSPIKITRPAQSQFRPNTIGGPPPANLYSSAYYLTLYPWKDASGYDWWPCGTQSDGFANYADCTDVNDVAYPGDAIEIGLPFFTFLLDGDPAQTPPIAPCDASTASDTTPCAQLNTFYQDDTIDTVNDLLYSIEVTQGPNVIYDSGKQDYGANKGSGDWLFPTDMNFGTLGQTGKNNGNCYPNDEYPLTSTTDTLPTITYPFVVAANKTCVDPARGFATVTVRTEVATSTWSYRLSKGTYTWTVKYTKVYELTQKFNIWFYATGE